MRTDKKVPKLRFKGFTDDWEQRRLGEVTSHRGGTAIEKYFDENGEYKVISIGSYGLDSKYVDQSIRAKSNEVTNERVVHAGELTMVLNDKTANGTIIGRSLLIENDNEYVINQRTEIIKPKESFNAKFAYTLLNGPFRNKVKRIVQGGTQIYVNYSSVEKLTVPLPNMKEQQKIGSFFNQLDSLIALHQRKLDAVKKLKKAMLQKMFSGKGQKQPEIRFAGFTDDWEQRKLGEVVEITMGQSPDSKNYTDNPNDHILVQGNADMLDGQVYPRIWTTQVTKTADKGELILSVRAPVGDVGKTKYDVVLGRGVAGIKGNDFVYYQLTKLNESGYWRRYSTGSTFESINSKDIKNAEIMIPSSLEQQEVGKFMKNIDSFITLHQRKLEKLKNLKKSMLEMMFV